MVREVERGVHEKYWEKLFFWIFAIKEETSLNFGLTSELK
jgi:hypothetical protein